MATGLDWDQLNSIFQPRQDILDGIKRCAETPGKVALFNEIASHVLKKLSENEEHDAKRRKLQNNGASTCGNPENETLLLCVKEISVAAPQRKKLELCLTQKCLYARVPGTTVPFQGIVYAWADIEYAFYLPVPEKAQAQYSYVLFPRGSAVPPKPGTTAMAEPLVFTVPITPPKEGTIGGSETVSAASVSDTYKSLFHWAISRRLQAAGGGVRIISPDLSQFYSMVRQPHRPNEKAMHVAAFRGPKDGFLFFMETGILWGFKRPLIFMPLKRIAATSYTSILQITFNIVVEVFPEEGEINDEYEFNMLDQKDFAGIDGYLKRNGLMDRSMAEQRKGKLQLAENRVRKEGNGGNAPGAGGGDTELERAGLGGNVDDDDEEEEDYDPGSDSDSDGSGESSEDEGGEDGGKEEEEEDIESTLDV